MTKLRKSSYEPHFTRADVVALFEKLFATESQGLKLGPFTFLWQDEVLKIKTPTGTEYLNRTQAADLLGYLYDQREALLDKHK